MKFGFSPQFPLLGNTTPPASINGFVYLYPRITGWFQLSGSTEKNIVLDQTLSPYVSTPGIIGTTSTVLQAFQHIGNQLSSLSILSTGPAGGDLTGNYPNPTLISIGPGIGTYNQVQLDTKGRVTGASLVTFVTGNTGTNFDISYNGSSYTFNLPDASLTNRGVINTIEQSITGQKTFSDTLQVDASTTIQGSLNGSGRAGIVLVSSDGNSNNARIATSSSGILLAFRNSVDTYGLQWTSSTATLSNDSTGTLGIYSGSNWIFDGTTSFIATHKTDLLTANRTYQMPDASGTLALVSNLTGINSLNGLTGQIQTLITGIAGSDFNISSSSTIHTFNLPFAGPSNHGKLSTTDWTTFNNKQPFITGAASSITGTNLTINSALISDGSGKVAVSPVSSTELSYLTGVTGAIQTQLNNRVLKTGDTMYGNLLFDPGLGIDASVLGQALNIGNINAGDINIATANNVQSVNIGTGNGITTTINIGGPNDIVNIAGTLNTINSTVINITGKFQTFNVSGPTGTSFGSGFQVADGLTSNAGYILVSGDMKGWDLKNPQNNFVSTLKNDNLTSNRTYLFPDATGTLALVSNITGINSLNGLTSQTQTIVSNTSGTDVNIQSTGSTHTINIPVASSSITGKLSSTDWTTFNNKQSALPLTGPGAGGPYNQVFVNELGLITSASFINVLSGAITTMNGLTSATQTFVVGTAGTNFNIQSTGSNHTFNIPIATTGVTGLLSESSFTTFNSKQDFITPGLTTQFYRGDKVFSDLYTAVNIIGNGVTKVFNISHTQGPDNICQVRDLSTNEVVITDIVIGNNLNIVSFINAPITGENYRVVVK